MGTRGHGTWAKLYADVWGHPKTMALARALEAIGVPRRWSIREAVGQLHQLACGLADQTDDGLIGHLAPRAFCALTGWDDHRKADAVLAAWMSSGFIDNPGTKDAKLHGFDELFGELVRKRSARRAAIGRTKSGHQADNGRPKSGLRPAVGPHKSESETELHPSGVSPLPLTGSGAAPDGAASLSPDGLATLWGEICPTLAQPARPLSEGIREGLRKALKRQKHRDWRATFGRIAASPKLLGQEYDWCCPGILWAVGPKNLAALDAGQHDPKNNAARGKANGSGRIAQSDAALAEFKRQAAAATEAEQEETPW